MSVNPVSLVINTEMLDHDEPLPGGYFGADTSVMGLSSRGNICGRCGGPWADHAWVLFVYWQSPLDCSRDPRRAA